MCEGRHDCTIPFNLLLICFVHKRRQSNVNTKFKDFNLAREIRGRRLNESVFREIEVSSGSSCRLYCEDERSCLS